MTSVHNMQKLRRIDVRRINVRRIDVRRVDVRRVDVRRIECDELSCDELIGHQVIRLRERRKISCTVNITSKVKVEDITTSYTD